jgi:type II secretory pathway predicted ATPase ExeA
MLSTIGIEPTSNCSMAGNGERMDAVQAFAKLLMGLALPAQFVSSAREISLFSDWPKPPTLERSWLAALADDDATRLDWRTRTLRRSLEGVGLRCSSQSVATPSSAPLSTAAYALEGRTVADAEQCESRHPFLQYKAVDEQAAQIRPRVDFTENPHGFYCASLVLRRWPRETTPGWLGQALAGSIPVDCAIHVRPEDPQQFARYLKQQEDWQSDQHTARPDAANALGRRDAGVMREKLIARSDSPVSAAIVLTVRASNRGDLKQRVETLGHEMRLVLADARIATFEQDRGLVATQPLAVCDLLGAWRTVDCLSLAATWPFQPATVCHTRGAPIGTTGSMLVRLDPFDLSLRSFGGLITGSVGSGKSFLMKLLLLGLEGCEKIVVEQSEPPEYAGLDGVQHVSLADLSETEQAAKLREFITSLWDTARTDPRPRLLVLDELWALIKRPELAALVEEVARRGRRHFLALWIASQQLEEILESAKAVFDNASIRIYLQQESRDLSNLAHAARLTQPAAQFLRGAARGEALLDLGKMVVPVEVQATPGQYSRISTDPRERAA